MKRDASTKDGLARERQVRGEDHPDTLTSARSLAVDLRRLGESQAARELDEDTLARRRRILGEDHPDTLVSARNLAADLRNLGEHQAARELDEDTLARRRRILARTTPTPWYRLTALPPTCGTWGSTRPPGSWTRTPWPAAAGSSARTTPRP